MMKSFAFPALLPFILFIVHGSPRSIALTPESNVSTKDISRALEKDCPNVSITTDISKSDFTLKARRRINEKGVEQEGFDLTLLDHDGRTLLSASNLLLDNTVKSVCRAINNSGKK
jgi:hypothetical protein